MECTGASSMKEISSVNESGANNTRRKISGRKMVSETVESEIQIL